MPDSITCTPRSALAAPGLPAGLVVFALALLACLLIGPATGRAARPVITIETPLSPPGWAVLERELLRANTAACQEFFARYFDDRGFLLCVERWGGDDGPDDAIENCNDWPILHAVGAPDSVLQMYKQAWEGHLRQFTLAKTTEVPFARDGMYYKEFPVMMDWLHNGEGLTVFDLQGLSDPDDADFQRRVRRYAGFYLNEDPQAPNYDPRHKIIRSLFNGSRGPLLRPATAVDWAGDPIEVEHRFRLGHGERNYQEMLDHFKDYTDIVGDHPSNLLATSLAMNAYLLTGEQKYKAWLLEYVDAWRQRMLDNRGILPSHVDLNGKVGGPDGKWWGGVYGWGFSVITPQTGEVAHRSTFQLGFVGFMNAFALTGDQRYLTPWRNMLDLVNAQVRNQNGVPTYPHKYGEQGWYDYSPDAFAPYAREMYYLTMDPVDRKWLASDGWYEYLEGRNPGYPEQALQADFAHVRNAVAGMRADTTTPDTRLSDDPMVYNPSAVGSLIQLMLGGIHPGRVGAPLYCHVRYFDPLQRRAGIPEDVAALVDRVTNDELAVTLVNTSQVAGHDVVLQAGAYGEHQIVDVLAGGNKTRVETSSLLVRLAPGAGKRLILSIKRFVNQPSLRFPWDR